jgi:hypothetical protein
MTGYKLNQVVFAISRTASDELTERDVSFRLKRLLALDRSEPRAAEHHFAFFDEKPQGKGVDVLFSTYEAFALFLANAMLEARFPQLTVLRLLRKARTKLSKAYKQCLEKQPATIGKIEDDPWTFGYPMFVVVGARGPGEVSPFAVCATNTARYEFTREYDRPGVGFSFFPLANAVQEFAKNLAEAPVRRRGRK